MINLFQIDRIWAKFEQDQRSLNFKIREVWEKLGGVRVDLRETERSLEKLIIKKTEV